MSGDKWGGEEPSVKNKENTNKSKYGLAYEWGQVWVGCSHHLGNWENIEANQKRSWNMRQTIGQV